MSAVTDAPDKIRQWREHPAQMVRELFGAKPDPWQDEVLEAFPHHQRLAMRACKNPGKTCTEAWLGWNYLLTRPHPKILATSMTGENLADGLWAEVAWWQKKSKVLQREFTWTRTRIFANSHPETWWMSARTWPKTASAEQQADTLAGLHADYTLAIIDECGAVPVPVLIAAEAMLGSGKEGHVLIGGNTNTKEGILYEACVTNRAKWHVITVTGDPDDPRRSTRVDINWARDLIARYGRSDPFVMVNVLGEFPSGSSNSLVSLDDIRAAQNRNYRESDIARFPRIISVDVAFEGVDLSIVMRRQGPVLYPWRRYRNIEPHIGAGIVAREWLDWDANACMIDSTGGYGAAWISHLKLTGRHPIAVNFAQRANDDLQFYNKRAEMHWLGAQWIKEEGMLPPDGTPGMAELTAAMTRTSYYENKGRLQIEPKELVKDKIGYSPDDSDGFVIGFSQPIAERRVRMFPQSEQRERQHQEWSPRAALDADRYGLMGSS